ncbi:MAG: class I SAM-dependent methyltransferase [Bacteroidetes bacterium]|nr:class I SAM-dependent methyltransferase [Bacteroidota bacterium]
MDKSYRDRIYKHYLGSIFNTGRDIQNIEKEYKDHFLYFNKNYSRFLPSDKNARILDAGCGLGHFLFYLNKLGYTNSVGIDLSEELVDFCKQKGFHAESSDFFNYLKNHKNTFDAIVINDVIEHLFKEEIMDLLDIILESLRPNGCVMIKTPNMANPYTAASSVYIDFTHETAFTETSMKEVLAVTNFKKVIVIGTDIYVFSMNPINHLAKCIAYISFKIYYFRNWLYGRKSLKIFEKDLLAVAYK